MFPALAPLCTLSVGAGRQAGSFFSYMNVCVCVFAYTKSTAVQKELVVVVVVAATMAALVVIAS